MNWFANKQITLILGLIQLIWDSQSIKKWPIKKQPLAQKPMCKQEVVQNLSQKQVPNLLVQVRNQSKQVDLEEVDLSIQ